MGKMGIPWLSAIGFGRGPRSETDFGDMGTAFGLDATMDDPEPSHALPPGLVGESLDESAAIAARADRPRRDAA